MVEVRPFQNRLMNDWLAVWSDQAARFPDFLAPITRQVLEQQILGNILFDPEGFLIAYDGGTPIGVLHAAFGPNADGSDVSRRCGIIYAPIIRTDMPVDRAAAAGALMRAGESYLRQRGSEFLYVGGFGNSSPFYTGLYGWTNPAGICDCDLETLGIVRSMGYASYKSARRFRLICSPFRPALTPKIQKAHQEVMISRFTRQTEPSWWDANIYRNFDSEEWNVFPRDSFNDDPIAGAVFRSMSPTYSPRGEIEQRRIRYILDFIAVAENYLRRGIASLLLTVCLVDLSRRHSAFTVDTIVDADDEPMAAFLAVSGFQDIGLVLSFRKSVS